jgi:uncharacterized protein
MPPRPVWFVLALIPMVMSQIVRLHQHDPETWIFFDYLGRLGALVILAVIPSARAVAFRRDRLRIVPSKIALWIVGIVLVDRYLGGWARQTVNAALPTMVLGVYPRPSGWLYFIDLVFGLGLVAYSEEIVFRRCARHVFQPYMGDRFALVFGTALLFGAYHWWAGLGIIIEATVAGVLLMLFLWRSEALWPVVLAHYLTDIIDFA